MSNTPAVIADIRIDKNDLVTVAVSRAERAMNQTLTEANQRLKAAEKQKAAAEKSLADINDATATAITGPAIVKMTEAAALLGGTLKFTTAHNTNKNNFNVTLAIVHPTINYNNVSLATTVPLNEKQTALMATIATLYDEVAQAKSDVLTIRQKLARIPTLERQYRAQLVEAELNKTDNGKSILAAMNGDLTNDILALPPC